MGGNLRQETLHCPARSCLIAELVAPMRSNVGTGVAGSPLSDKRVHLAVCVVRRGHLLSACSQGNLTGAALFKGTCKLCDWHKLVRSGVVRPVLLQGHTRHSEVASSVTGTRIWSLTLPSY